MSDIEHSFGVWLAGSNPIDDHVLDGTGSIKHLKRTYPSGTAVSDVLAELSAGTNYDLEWIAEDIDGNTARGATIGFRTLSTGDIAVIEAYARADTGTRHLLAIEFTHTALPGGALRIINYDTDITVGGDVYVGAGIQATEPSRGTDPDSQMQIIIDGTSRAYQQLLAAANVTPDPIPVTITPILYNIVASTVVHEHNPYDYEVRRIRPSLSSLNVELGSMSPANSPFPREKYSPFNRPELYT